ncbi:RNA 2',3'-cyclic phosphodiesterase [Desulfoferrobacter suflitae]|uniref:RNA 2',3'-cyclic phosphodiesterase n=1 Tax=Desulfoferrobacter suflitae TaxID=2865782 RepID=UPI002164823A|nr:RNA 2',3'-cyclic phosphodiesterase [Desulfoferrobacter suflitae]MCK8600898.1 RNA 2',3'-cyclic phosphodiesterase [Desulfoferrobacter suflitae]
MIRTFIAVDVPFLVKRELEKFAGELKMSGALVTWVKPERMHLTLKFLGDVSPEQIEPIGQALQQAATGIHPVHLQPAGCGAFPSLKQMRVVWVGLRGDVDLLQTLHKRVETALTTLGFAAEERPFKAHLTLGRVKGKKHLNLLQEALLAHRQFTAGAFAVTELTLYRSDLRPTGPIYQPLLRVPLGTGTDGFGDGLVTEPP